MNPLETIIREIIASQGAISLATYMELALQDPTYGYYRVREPLGRTGDFITAPEVSQMFGEMIGIWCAETWRTLGKPDPFALVELGPGRGTMMQDILRSTAHVAGFHTAKQLYLLDSDKALREQQSEKLGENDLHYIDDIRQVPPMPTLILANEFFDALPVRQFEKTFRGWAERMVIVANDKLTLTPSVFETPAPPSSPPSRGEGLGGGDAEIKHLKNAFDLPPDALPNTILEISPKAQNIMHSLAQHVHTHHGAMLIIDYGYTAPSGAATLQAVSNHSYADIFDRPGEVDLTAHVDFTALANVATQAGTAVSPVIGQGEFLKNMGIDIRADQLKKRATMPQAASIDAELHRLTDPDQMGTLFKVMEIRG